MNQGVPRPDWPTGTLLDGDFSIGYWPRRAYFQVVGHTNGGAPRVVRLQNQVLSQHSSPADSNTQHCLLLPPTPMPNEPTYVARWRPKEGCWGICLAAWTSNDKHKVSLAMHVPWSTFDEPSYG